MVNVDDQRGDSDASIGLVVEALQAVNRVAALDSETYQASLTAGLVRSADETFVLQSKLIALKESLRGDDAIAHVIEGLAQSIHRFHSNLHLLKLEGDRHTADVQEQQTEIHSLQQYVAELEERNGILDDRVRESELDKHRMKANLKQATKERKLLIRHALSLTEQIEHGKKTQVELQLLAHEQVLMWDVVRNRKESADTTSTFSIGTTSDGLHDSCILGDNDTCWEQNSVPTLVTTTGAVPLRFTSDTESEFNEDSLASLPQRELAHVSSSKGLLDDAILKYESGNLTNMDQAEVGPIQQQDEENHPHSFLRGLRLNSFLGKQKDTSDRSLYVEDVVSKDQECFEKMKPLDESDKLNMSGFRFGFLNKGRVRESVPDSVLTKVDVDDTDSSALDDDAGELEQANTGEVDDRSGHRGPLAVFPFWRRETIKDERKDKKIEDDSVDY